MTHDRYRIVATIGRGGMGEVCLADDPTLDRQVALKFLTASGEHDVLDQLLAEARAAAALDHPFICSIYDVSSLDGRPCIAMEYVRGETLERRLRRGPLPLADALRVAEEIAEALDAAHRRRVVHGDLKPANVMLTEDHHVKVMDFGLARRLPAGDEGGAAAWPGEGEPGVVRGTPAYMAPEQIRGEPADRRSDIFALGVLLYQLLSGTHPFLRLGTDATLAAILSEPASDLHQQVPAIPPALSAVVAQMLAKRADARHQSFAEVRRDLRRVAADLAASAAPPPPVAAESTPGTASATVIGRTAERAQLMQIIGEAAAGRGALLLLSGEAGMGKTRLADEALQAARRRGCHTLVGRCSEQEGTPPLIPYIEVLEAASRLIPAPVFRQAIAPAAPELAKLLPELHRLFPDMPAPLELPASLRQRFLFTNVRDFLARCSRFAPLVVLLDDLQWADEPSLRLTQFLAPQLSELPIVIIAAYRDLDVPRAVAKSRWQHLFERVRGQGRGSAAPPTADAALRPLVAQGQAHAITLRPLTEPDVHDMLATLAGRQPPARLVRRLVDQTGGNPFFLTELFRHLRDEGRLFDAHGMWTRDVDLDALVVPETVRAIVERRLHRISRQTQDVLRAAAVIGRHFEADLLETVADLDDDALMAALEEGERAHLLKGPSGRQEVTWHFTHQLVCQTLLHTLPAARRQRLHLRVAQAMERTDAASRVHTSAIAYHLYSAGRLADAGATARALTEAGDAAHALYATDEAVQHYRRALEVLDGAGDGRAARTAIEERLADLLALLGDRPAAMAHYEAVARAHDDRGDAVARARVDRKVGTLHWQAGDRGAAMACYHRALQALDGAPARLEAAHVYQELGLAAFRSGDNPQAIAWAERALRAAEEALGQPAADASARREAAAAVAHATNTIGIALARGGELEAARERIERSVHAAREQGLLDVACRAYANLGVLYSTVEPQRAIDVSLTGLELASRIGAASLQSYIYANLAAAYCALTDRCETEGLQAARAAADLDRQLGQLDHLAVPLIVIAQIHQCRGELDEAQRHYLEALALAEQTGEPQLLVPCLDGLATVCLDRGDRVRAAEYMDRVQGLCERSGLDPDTLLLLPFLS